VTAFGSHTPAGPPAGHTGRRGPPSSSLERPRDSPRPPRHVREGRLPARCRGSQGRGCVVQEPLGHPETCRFGRSYAHARGRVDSARDRKPVPPRANTNTSHHCHLLSVPPAPCPAFCWSSTASRVVGPDAREPGHRARVVWREPAGPSPASDRRAVLRSRSAQARPAKTVPSGQTRVICSGSSRLLCSRSLASASVRQTTHDRLEATHEHP